MLCSMPMKKITHKMFWLYPVLSIILYIVETYLNWGGHMEADMEGIN